MMRMGGSSAMAETIADEHRLLSFVNVVTGVSFLVINKLDPLKTKQISFSDRSLIERR